MCGICGIYSFDQQPVQPDLVRRMANSILHRGPDEEGFLFDGPVGLGMRRLSIIDLAGGSQPVYNEDGTVGIVYNGEIYEYIELRRELERLGHRFTTRSDTEVVVHAYEQYGERCVDYLVGMFAFAIWDSRRRELFVARDRLGEKPLFYTRIGDQLLFASEIKALLQHPGCSRELSEEGLSHYLSALYIPFPDTMFRDIAKLPPGHWMRVSENGIRIERYWFPERLRPHRASIDEAIDEFRTLFADAVRVQMRSDVPVGASLSSGMDSTSVVAYVARMTDDARLKTFAVGFTGADWDERPGARAVANLFGTEHYDITVSPTDVVRLLPRLAWLLDEPMGDASIVPVFMVSQLARQHVKVLLNGAGGDEVFAGYPRYMIGQLPFYRRMLQSVPPPVKSAAVRVAALRSHGFANRVHVALRSVDRHYYEDTTWFTEAERRALTGRNGSAYAAVVREHYHRLGWADPINRLQFVDMNTYLSDDLLPQVDRMTMGVSLEGRTPFLDYRLIEWSLTLPSELKLRNGTSKYLLRRAMENVLPRGILDRPKRGFGPPLSSWLQSGLLDVTRRLLMSTAARRRGFYDSEAIEDLLSADIREHRTAQQIWMLLILETWLRVYVDGHGVSEPSAGLAELL